MPPVGFAHCPGSVLLLKHYRNADTNHFASLYWVRIWCYILSTENSARDIHSREIHSAHHQSSYENLPFELVVRSIGGVLVRPMP
jgi:hypothetical protein